MSRELEGSASFINIAKYKFLNMHTFSIRHKKALEDKKIDLKLSKKLRERIINVIEGYNFWYDTQGYNGWNESRTIYDDVRQNLLKIYGGEKLRAYINDEYTEVDSIKDFILGCSPKFVLDLVEVFYLQIPDDQKYKLQKEINFIFISEGSFLRILDGLFLIIDSDFAQSEILEKAVELLEKGGFEKALDDFKSAFRKLSVEDFNGCVFECNNALESTIKKITGEKAENQGSLKKALIKANLIPSYFQGFVEHFENFTQAAFTIANKSVRHGKDKMPSEEDKVTKEVANFLLNLVGSILIFIIERYSQANPPQSIPVINSEEDDLPF